MFSIQGQTPIILNDIENLACVKIEIDRKGFNFERGTILNKIIAIHKNKSPLQKLKTRNL